MVAVARKGEAPIARVAADFADLVLVPDPLVVGRRPRRRPHRPRRRWSGPHAGAGRRRAPGPAQAHQARRAGDRGPAPGDRVLHPGRPPARGLQAGRNRVQRLCSLARIFSAHSVKRGSGRRPGPPVHDDLVRREFTAPAPDQLWLTDITEHPTGEGKLYLCAVKDACSRRIVGYSMDSRMTSALAVDALANALAQRSPAPGTMIHSDRGSQFRSHAYVQALREAGLAGSMGRVGTCADNAAMESFFSLLQKNVLNRQRWATRQDLRHAILVWTEKTYHRRRRQEALGRLTPVAYEILLRAAHAA